MGRKARGISTQSIKHLLIDQTNARIVLSVSVSVFVIVFSLVASKTIWSQAAYQNSLIAKKTAAKNQIESNLKIVKQLKPSYEAFVGATTNVIKGNALGSGPQDGDNAKITLDALPNRYNYPALITNLEKIVSDQGMQIGSIVGVDDAIAQSTNTQNPNPVAVEMPFQIGINGDYTKTQAFIGALERSIRPMRVQIIDISGSKDMLNTNITAVTYYQPSKSFGVRSETEQ